MHLRTIKHQYLLALSRRLKSELFRKHKMVNIGEIGIMDTWSKAKRLTGSQIKTLENE